jgi:type III secretory pathway component EscV
MKANDIKKEIDEELMKSQRAAKGLQQNKITSLIEAQMAIESTQEDVRLLALHVKQNLDRLIQVQRDFGEQFVAFELDHQEELKFIKDILQNTKTGSNITIDENFRKLLLDDIEEKNRAILEQVKRIINNRPQDKSNLPLIFIGIIGILAAAIIVFAIRS